MIAVLTGDIINSRKGETSDWLEKLKIVLNKYGKNPGNWEIYRGDSFQISLPPKEALFVAFHIKSELKQSNSQDVRIAIGIGEESHKAKKISESNGQAFIRSGESFEKLKKQSLILNTGNQEIDISLNLMLRIILLTANNWSQLVAKVISFVIENPNKQQKEIAQLLNKSQSSISEALKRGGFEEMKNLNEFYKTQIEKL